MIPPETLAVLFGLGLLALVLVVASRKSQPVPPTPEQHPLRITYPPTRIGLTPRNEVSWMNMAHLNEMASALHDLKFQEIGRFEIAESPGHFLWAFVKPQVAVTAVLGEFKAFGASLEMATHYRDATSFVFTDQVRTAWARTAPHWTVVRVSGLDVPAIYRRLLAERPVGPMDADTVENFASRYEERWGRIMDWRNTRGGFSEDEIRGLCAAQGLSATETMIAECRQQVRERALGGLEISVLDHFLAQSSLTDKEAEELGPRLLAIHDRLPPERLMPLFELRGMSKQEAEEAVRSAASTRQVFAAFNERLAERPFRLLGRAAEPVEADVYEAT